MALESCDVVFRNAIVIDGSGAPRREADVAVRGERVAALGRLEGWRAEREIDASGRVLAPGFIDVHTHDDRLLLAQPDMTPKLSQGVTTVIGGNCGISLAPLVADRVPPPLDLLDAGGSYRYPRFADYLEELGARPAALNAALLVGHSTLRVATMDRLDRAATKSEIARMRAIVAESLDAGAIGLSTGLFYAPANAAPTEEVIELCAPLRERGALYVTHMRDEADHLLESLEETFRIGREAGVPAFISHHKAAGVANHGKTRQSLAAIEAAMRAQPVALDAYPYAASSTVLRWDMAARASKTLVTWSKAHPEFAGRTLDEVARAMGCGRRAGGGQAAAGRRGVLPDERGGRAARARLRADDDRLGRPAARRPSAPAPVGNLPARARPLCARRGAVHARAGGAQDDRPVGAQLRAGRARPGRARRLCGPHSVRSRCGCATRRASSIPPRPPRASSW